MNKKRLPLQRSTVKYGVRMALTGNVFKAFAACLIPMLLTWVLRLVPNNLWVVYVEISEGFIVGVSAFSMLLSMAVSIFAADPMAVRLAGYFLQLNRDAESLPSPLTVCDCFDQEYGRLLRGTFLRSAFVTVGSALPLLLGALLPGSLSIVTVSDLQVVRMSNVFSLFLLAAAAINVYLSLDLAMVPYILADQPGLTATEALRESRILMHGRRIEYIVMELSFIGWLLLVSVTMFVAAVYALPYMEGTFAAYYIGFQEALHGAGGDDAP